MTRLDEMDFNEITIKYKDIFKNIISEDVFTKIKNGIENIYNEYITFININYKIKGGTLGRGELKWGRNIIWGWYIEMLLRELLSKNAGIKKVEFIGGDLSHKFIFTDDKRIEILGKKSVEPDFLITLHNDKKFCIELKTAAVEVFSIKKGNIEQLYKETAYNNRITLILMVDLENELYSLENLTYFNILQPFVNQRMEGQLCYNFPSPEKVISNIISENFEDYLDESIFSHIKIKKLKALKKAEDIEDKRFVRIIKNKIALEKKEENMKVAHDLFEIEVLNIKKKCPEIDMEWDEIYKALKI
jgi:hypothetical protein